MTQSRVFVAEPRAFGATIFFTPQECRRTAPSSGRGTPAAARLGRDLEQAVGGRDEQGRLGAVIGFTYAMPTVLRDHC